MDYNTEVGKRIKKARIDAEMSLKTLGEKVDLSEATMQRYESGKIKGVDINMVKRLAVALNVSPAHLLGWDNEENTQEESDIDSLEFALSTEAKDMTDEMKQSVLDFMRFIKEQEKKEK